MERIKQLNRFQKGVLLVLAALALGFTICYAVTIARVGFSYREAILIPDEQDGSTIYSGSLQGTQVSFTVSEDKTVYFQYGDQTYGPYTAQEDSTAVPEEHSMREAMTGVELRCGEEILFRGGVLELDGERYLYNEDGSPAFLEISVVTGDGLQWDEDGEQVDPAEPDAASLLALMAGPELTHKGTWVMWLLGMFLCAVTAISVLFADELFRLHMAFHVIGAAEAEPSDWEIMGRYLSWIALPILVLAAFLKGLQ